MARESGTKLVAQNKKARHDYHIEQTYEAGIVLTGTEVKALRAGRASLVDGFAQVQDGEIWLQTLWLTRSAKFAVLALKAVVLRFARLLPMTLSCC